ncbi:MAG: discoidin domain-containing protein [Sedimentisphaerales bacterium]|nr:discoidin domain-containing protein [Sedimentisphaerales bacterium]
MTKKSNVNLLLIRGVAAIICLLGVMARQVNAERAEVAEDLLVDLRSEDLSPGSVSEWPNRGSLGGVFMAFGNPVVEAVGGWDNVVIFDGESYFDGSVSPFGIVGRGTRTIEVWAYNIGESKEECMVAWSHRGGPDGSNMTFNWGYKDFGAVGHWGDDADMAWGGQEGVEPHPYPALENWQYLVYTYDGATGRLYVNGELAVEKDMALNTHSGNVIRVGTQTNSDGSAFIGEKMFSGAIAQVRIHDGALTLEQIQKNALIRIQTSGQVSNPRPKNNDPDVPLRDLILSWEPGEFPGKYTVYFGEDVSAVESGTAEVISGLDINSYDPGPLNYETTYYWRVDEVNDSPDKTVYEGSVWNFTTEPYAITIPTQAISATASSQAQGQGPENTINESGLVGDLHSTEATAMWATVEGEATPAWIQYEFDKTYQLHEMLVWNYNGASFLATLGLQDVTVEYSTDGVDWILNDSVAVLNQATGKEGYAANTTVPFGDVPAKYVRITATTNWSGNFLVQHGLSEVRFIQIPVSAREPDPDDGDSEVDINVTLNWRAGREADEHKVYISTDEQAVIGRTVAPVTVNEAGYGPLSLALASTYYWRVDEVNNASAVPVWEGDVWSFTTSDYRVVDDFESYNDIPQGEEGSNLVYLTWIDGYDNPSTNGSTIGYTSGASLEMATVRSGHSAPLIYDDTTAGISEVNANTNDLKSGSDWTIGSPEQLVVWVYGSADNNSSTDRMYVEVDGVKRIFSGDIALEQWQDFPIDLASLGINLNNVGTVTIGFEKTGSAGGSGRVFIDDILLYSPL